MAHPTGGDIELSLGTIRKPFGQLSNSEEDVTFTLLIEFTLYVII